MEELQGRLALLFLNLGGSYKGIQCIHCVFTKSHICLGWFSVSVFNFTI